MKRILIILLLFLMNIFCMSGCIESKPYDTIMSGNRFIVTSERTSGNTVYVEMYDKDTRVMYCFIKLGSGGSFCPLIDENGKPLLWQGD